jgi:hypothetical protein
MMEDGPTKAQMSLATKVLDTAKDLAVWYSRFKPEIRTLTFASAHYKALQEVADRSAASGRPSSQVWRNREDGTLRAHIAGSVWIITKQGE